MSRILHIIRTSDDAKALECIIAQAKDWSISLLLMQEGVHTKPPSGVKTYILNNDAGNADTQADTHPITYDEMVKLLFTHDSVVVW